MQPATLTLQDVLDLLPELAARYDWHIDQRGRIRAPWNDVEVPEDWEFSPLTALCYMLTGECYEPWLQWDEAATALWLPLDLASELIGAEDGQTTYFDGRLRQQLVQDLGLKERPCAPLP